MITKPKPIKPKKCKNCGELFSPERPFQKCCKYSCAIDYVALIKTKEQKEVKKQNNKAKKEFNQNDRKYLLEIAQKTVNTFIRMRDGKHCISCEFEPHFDKKGVLVDRQFQAGHYKSQGGNSALRFDENNIHAQCSICNNHLSANLVKYRANLIDKIGLDEVIRLETTKNTKLWTVEELQGIIATYKAKLKQFK